MTLAGAILAPRWSYMDATVAFNPNTSFLTVIMALLGGATSVWGPMLGVIPLVLISDYLSVTVPNYFSVVLGLVLLAIVFLVPGGLIGLLRPDRPFGRPAAARRPPARARPTPRCPPPRQPPGRAVLVAASAGQALAERGAERRAMTGVALPLLEVSDLSRNFGGLAALDGVSFKVAAGSILGLIGPNGSGKTTLLNIVCGRLEAHRGEVRLAGQPITGRTS